MRRQPLMLFTILMITFITSSTAGLLSGSLFGIYGGNRRHSSTSEDDSSQQVSNKEEGIFRQSKGHETLKVICDVNGRSVSGVIDTGAQISIMSTEFAKRCALFDKIDKRFAGRAVGVGSSAILGRLNNLTVRLGALQFKSDFSVLSNTNVDFIIGLDILRKFQSDVCLRENVIKMFHQNKVFRVPIATNDINCLSYEQSDQEDEFDNVDESNEMRIPYHGGGMETDDDFDEVECGSNNEDLLSMEGV